MDTGNGVTHLLSTSQDHRQLCLHKLANGPNDPNPILQLACNKTSINLYLDITYSPTEGLIVTGDNQKVFMFKYKSDAFTYLSEIVQPQSSEVHFAAIFPEKTEDQNKELLTVNGLYLNMIIYDESVPTAMILQSEKTEKLTTKGFSD